MPATTITLTTDNRKVIQDERVKHLIHNALQILLSLNLLVDYTTTQTYLNLLSASKSHRQYIENYKIHKRAPYVVLGKQYWQRGQINAILFESLKENDVKRFTGALWAIPPSRYHSPKWQKVLGDLMVKAARRNAKVGFVSALLDKPYDLGRFGTEERAMSLAVSTKVREMFLASGRLYPVDGESEDPYERQRYRSIISALHCSIICRDVTITPLLKLVKRLTVEDSLRLLENAIRNGQLIDKALWSLVDFNSTRRSRYLATWAIIQSRPNNSKAPAPTPSSTPTQFESILLESGLNLAISAHIIDAAAGKGITYIIRHALNSGFKIDHRLEHAFQCSAANGHLETLKLLLANVQDNISQQTFTEIIQSYTLIRDGVDVNTDDGILFQIVASTGAQNQAHAKTMFDSLVKGGLDMSLPIISKAVVTVCGTFHTFALTELVKAGADPSCYSCLGLLKTVTLNEGVCECGACWSGKTMGYLLAVGIDFGFYLVGVETVLAAVEKNKLGSLEIMVSAGFNCGSCSDYDLDRLLRAALNSLDALVVTGAKLDGEVGLEVLTTAIRERKWSHAKLLVKNGAPVDL
ncbi:hypothetical protein HDU76_007867, partial [Blyttiomyces sp. JEL0837]